jgi:hypothetical protein
MSPTTKNVNKHIPLAEEAEVRLVRQDSGVRKGPSVLRVLALFVMSVATLWASAGPVFASSGIPFRAHFVATEVITPDAACGGLHIVATASGWATHLGARTMASFDECANFVEEPGRVHVYGTVVLTSHRGDELHLTVDKVGNAPDAAGNVHVAGPFTVTGGTGRFAGATGGGTTTTDTNVASNVATADLTGTLSRLSPRSPR